MSISILLSSYLFASNHASVLGHLIAKRRLKLGKEDPSRVLERFGLPSKSRPKGQLIWIHSASVGEAISVISLVKFLKKMHPKGIILLTTGTVSSSKILRDYIGEGILHQFVPYDVRPWLKKFLKHWHPSIAILVESELWPALIIETKEAKIPLLLINGRMSSKSLKYWQKFPATAKKLLTKIDYIIVQTQELLTPLVNLGYPKEKIEVINTLKQSSEPLPYNQQDLDEIREAINNKVVWVVASTHLGEEEQILEIFYSLSQKLSDLFLILVPRHPERGEEVKQIVNDFGFETNLRSKGVLPSVKDRIYIADTLGEMGLWYRLGDFAFIGGSLVPIGGHNPYEPALLDCPIIHGPHTFNFKDAYQKLIKFTGSIPITTPKELEQAIEKIYSIKYQNQLSKNAKIIVSGNSQSIQRTAEKICEHL